MDERDAYKHTDGKVYDASGKVLGHSNNVSFIPKRNAMSGCQVRLREMWMIPSILSSVLCR